MACAFLVVLAGCGGEGDGSGLPSPTRTPTVEPTRTPTRTPALPSGSPGASDSSEASDSALPSESATSSSTPSSSTPSSPETSDGPTPTRTPSERPSRSPDRTPRPTATITVTDSPTPTPTTTPTTAAPSTEPPASADADADDTAGDTAGDEGTDDAVPTWLWWVVGAVVLLLAIGLPLLVRHRRRASWAADLAASEAEMAWFARQLVPELRHDLGAWTVSNAARVTEAEDQLTALASRGRDDIARARALELRDAVRRSRQDVEAMTTTPGPTQEALDAVQARIETALGEADR